MRRKFRELPMVFVCLLMFGCFLLGDIHPPSVQAAGEVWTFVDGNLSTGLNKDAVRHAINPAMVVFDNELYVAWSEFNSSMSQIRVRKYDGSTWSWVDGGGSTGINYNTGENAIHPNLIVFSSNLYAIFSETYSGVYVTRVKRYDGGSTWTAIDGSVTNGLNKDSVTCGSTSGPSFGICNGYLYAAWVETYSGAGGAYQLHVKRYDSGTSWTFVDGGGFTGLNYDTNRSANKPKLLALNNTLYLIWTEVNPSAKYQIRVKRYDGGSTWTTVDGGSGLNYNSANTVDDARLIIYNNSLYAYWLENYFVRVKSYNGSAWSTADGNAGFKQNALNYAYAESPPAAIPYGNKLYFTWGEDISYDPWSIQTRASYYYSSAMTFIDGNDWTTGLNYNRLQYAYKQAIVEYNGVLYLAWYESNGSANQLRVRSTPLPARHDIVDFDGDERTDIAFYRSSTGVWWITPSSGAPAYGYGWGGPGFKPVPGDYDGDTKTDIAIYDTTGGAWWITPSSGTPAYGVGWGGSAYKPVPGDYDGDTKTDIAIYDTTAGAWWVIPSSGVGPQGQVGAYGVGWGGSGFKPVPGDYDGDRRTDIAIYDTTGGAWWIIPSSGIPGYGVGWGGSGFTPVSGDYDGDAKTDVAIYGTASGGWWIIPSSGTGPQGQVGTYGVGWGGSGFTPVPGDYDGDGKTDVAIYQSSTGGWWIIYSSDESYYGLGWGGDVSDIPLITNPD